MSAYANCFLKKSCWVFRTVRAGLVSRLIASRAELVT